MTSLWPWVAFNAAVLVILTVDLGLFHRSEHPVSVREAGAWTAVWVTLALAFAAGIFLVQGAQTGTEFLSGYLIEYSLSVDNIFVFVLIFSHFGTKREYQHRVLFWGIIGALLMRGAMIAVGAALIQRFEWVTYLFGAVLVVAGVRMWVAGEQGEVDAETNPVLRLIRRVVPVSTRSHGKRFFTRETDTRGRLRTVATPLFVTLVLIEVMDLVFAVDSIPAVFAVTRTPFIVYTSNVCAILGLRSLYFLLAGAIHRLQYLHYGLAVILAFVGAKMLLAERYVLSTSLSLVIICFILAVTVLWSLSVASGPGHAAKSKEGG